MVRRAIVKKWSTIPQVNKPNHQQNLLLPPDHWTEFDPFLLMAEDYMKRGAFDHHPHRGIETVIYLLDGVLRHRDNQGNEGLLTKGDTQWMTAGQGILHIEEAMDDQYVHLLQLWVNLPAKDKLVAPRYQEIYSEQAPIRKSEGVSVKVISGSSKGLISPTQNYAAVTMVEIHLETGYSVSQDLPADYNGFIYIIQGKGTFGVDEMLGEKGEVLWMSNSQTAESEVVLRASESLRCLLIAGKPLREPVVVKGPFAMNSEEEIKEAYRDFRMGKFGEWPVYQT